MFMRDDNGLARVRSLARCMHMSVVLLLHTFVHSSDNVNKFFHFSEKFICRFKLSGRKYSTRSNLSNNAKEFLNNPFLFLLLVCVCVCVCARTRVRVFVSKRARFSFKSQKRANYTTNMDT